MRATWAIWKSQGFSQDLSHLFQGLSQILVWSGKGFLDAGLAGEMADLQRDGLQVVLCCHFTREAYLAFFHLLHGVPTQDLGVRLCSPGDWIQHWKVKDTRCHTKCFCARVGLLLTPRGARWAHCWCFLLLYVKESHATGAKHSSTSAWQFKLSVALTPGSAWETTSPHQLTISFPQQQPALPPQAWFLWCGACCHKEVTSICHVQL